MRFGFFSVQDFHPELGLSPATYFEQVLQRIRHAEALGYASFWLAEHHFHTYGLNPAPAVVLAAAARETQRIRLGSAIAVLPFHHPIHIAEHYALVDILSNGRLEFGVGSGYLQHEFTGFAVPPDDKSERFSDRTRPFLWVSCAPSRPIESDARGTRSWASRTPRSTIWPKWPR